MPERHTQAKPQPQASEDAETREPTGDAQAEPQGGEAPTEQHGEAPSEQPDDAEARLAALERERDSYLELAKRTQADFDNYKKRTARELGQTSARARAEVISELLSVVDNLERALCVEHDSADALKEGVELVYRELLSVLDRSGVERFGAGGEAFDPNLHEALAARSAEGTAAGVVLEVAQTGYKLDGAVIRPARVVVSN